MSRQLKAFLSVVPRFWLPCPRGRAIPKAFAPASRQRLLCRFLAISIAMLAVAGSVTGCDKKEPRVVTRITPSTRPAVLLPATAPHAQLPHSATLPAAFLYVGGEALAFPPARLIVQQRRPLLEMKFSSDDPPEALLPDYNGNSFIFDINDDLPGRELLSQGGWNWEQHADSHEDDERPFGIYLDGNRTRLQPADVVIEFTPTSEPGKIAITLRGQFLAFKQDNPAVGAPAVGQPVTVAGSLIATIQEK